MIESGSYAGNYSALGPVMNSGSYKGDRAYGAYQVMGGNIAPWTEEIFGRAMTKSEFLASREAQDRVYAAQIGKSLDKFGDIRDAMSVWFSGRPLSRAGNSSDGYNTVPQYVSKFDAALANYGGGGIAGVPIPTARPEVLTRAVSDGTVDATRRIGVSAHIAAGSGMNVGFDTGAQGNFFQRGGGQVLGAGAGAFFGGMQSGNPLMGGISGAMSGLGAAGALGSAFPALGAAAGPVGIIGGAILGIVGGIFGNSQKKREERRKAQTELESQLGAINTLIDDITGQFVGPFLQRFRETTDELRKARELAKKAGAGDLVTEIDDATELFFDNLVDDWNRSVDGVVESLNAGHGFGGAFVEANEQIKEMEKSLIGFVEDARFFSEAAGDMGTALEYATGKGRMGQHSKPDFQFNREADIPNDYIDFVRRHVETLTEIGLSPYSEMRRFGREEGIVGGDNTYESVEGLMAAMRDLGIVFNEFGDVVEETVDIAAEALRVQEAQAAARMQLLRSLSGAEEFTAVEEALQGLYGRASAMPPILEKLGHTAEEAAAAIDEHLNIGIANLRDDFTDTIRRDINSLNDRGYIDAIVDLHENLEVAMADAERLGLDIVGQLYERFNLQAQEIVNSADVTGAAFEEFLTIFPHLTDKVVDASDAVGTAAERWEALVDRFNQFDDRTIAAQYDPQNNLDHALYVFDRQAQREREAEAEAGNGAIMQLERALAAERLKIMEDFAERVREREMGYADRLFAATNDAEGLAGQLAAFDRSAIRDRMAEMEAGGQAMASLEAALSAERMAIIRDFNKQAIEESKRALEEAESFLEGWFRSLSEYVDGLRSGADSPLSPQDRLAAAQSQYNEQLALARNGDRDAANALTGYASDLLEAGRGYWASSEGYQDIFDAVVAQLEAIPDQVSAEQFIVDAIAESRDAMVDATTSMQEVLGNAFAAGPAATATALSAYFGMLDTSLDGLLSYSEMQAALSGIATDAQIRTMMNTLDANGDGQLSKLELIRQLDQGINLNTDQTETNTALTASRMLALSNNTSSTLSYSASLQEQMVTRLSAIVTNTNRIGTGPGGGYMAGGYTGNMGVNQIAGVVHGQEYVLSAEATRQIGRPMLDAMNQGRMRMPTIAMPSMPAMNDNGGLERRLERVERAVLEIGDQIARATVSGAKHVREGVDGVRNEQAQMTREAKIKAA